MFGLPIDLVIAAAAGAAFRHFCPAVALEIYSNIKGAYLFVVEEIDDLFGSDEEDSE